MVQLTDNSGSDQSPISVYPQAYFPSLDQLPQTSLTQQSMSDSSPVSHAALTAEHCGEVGYEFSGQPGTSSTFLPPTPHTVDSMYVGVQSQSFTTCGSVDMLPQTVLTSDLRGYESQTCSDISTEVSKTFEVIPVRDSCYDNVDNGKGSEDTETSPLKETRMDSLDSLLEGKGYSSDSSSDVYMNSDYTDTVTSAESSVFLLASNNSTHTHTDSTEIHTEQTAAAFYNNDAFDTQHTPNLIAWSSEDSVCEKTEESKSEESSGENINWVISVPHEDPGVMADKEDDDEEQEHKAFEEQQEDSALVNLVTQLVEQHPMEVQDIKIQILDGPVYEPLTEPLEEGCWLQSTDSLHHYKLLKQGRSTTLNSLHLHAINNLRSNTMNNLHERSSFLNLTAASVTNLGNACQKALSYVRADMEFGSMMSLRNNPFSSSLLPPGEQPPQEDDVFISGKKVGQAAVASGCHTRNVLYMALLVTILLISVNTTRNLQSSLNQEGGVGIICLAVMFASFMLGSLLSPVLVQGQGVKASIIAGLVLQLVYVAANLYPVLWLMLPASLGGGASLALIWNAMSTYIVLLARGESNYKQKSYQRISDKYFGIFCLIYQSNLIIGNLIASLVLTFAGGDASGTPVPVSNITNVTSLPHVEAASAVSTPIPEVAFEMLGKIVDESLDKLNNSSPLPQAFDAATESHYHLCGSAFCHHFDINQDASAVPAQTVYLLFGIFIFLVGVSIVIAIFLLEPLSPRPFSSSATPWSNVKRQVLSFVKFSRNVKFLLMLPLLLYSSMQFSFICSEVMMAYVTCPVGVWLVGYTMIGYGVCCSLASYVTQALVPRTGRGFFIGTATVINVGLLVFMRMWQPHPDSVFPLFIITTLFGITDGIWNVNANGLCGSVFPDHYEEAFTGLRVAQGLGGAFSMAYAPFFCMAVKIYVMIGAVVFVLVGYVGAEVLIKRDLRQKSAMFEKEIV